MSTLRKLLRCPEVVPPKGPLGETAMEVLCARCAGIDVHKKTVVVCARWVDPDGRAVSEVRTYPTMTADLLAMVDWLTSLGVEKVAMESTGVYWKPVYHLLEGPFEVLLVNAAHIKNVPGRKTDVKDAEWIAQLLAHGLLRGSFIPPVPVRRLRDLTRQRATLVRDRATVANRIQKLLEDCNLKLGDVASDVLGKSGRSILEAIAGGASDPDALAERALGRLREKIPQLRQALAGTVTDHHRFLLRSLLDQVAFFDAQVERFDGRIVALLGEPAAEESGPTAAPGGPAAMTASEAVDRVMTIPGVGRRAAEMIVGEIGPAMTAFPDAAHLCSWAGMCPGNHQSAGKRMGGKTTKGSQYLRTILTQVAWSASHTKATVFRLSYQCWSRRLGKKRALVALGHKILRVVYHLLKDRTTYVERLAASQAT